MPNLAKILPACTAFFLLLSLATAAAAAAPRAEHAAPAAASQRDQVAHYGEQSAAPRPERPERFVRIAGFSWSKAVEVIEADLTIESALPFALQEVELACAQFARSGVEIETSKHTIAEVVPARGRLQVEALDIGRINPEAGSSGCWVVSVTPA